MKHTVLTLQKMKEDGEKITMVTAYDYTTAAIASESGIDTILVGDSLGMTMLGYDDTLAVTMDDMIHHARAVTRGAGDTFVICDMPFMSYQASVYDAVTNAGRIMKESGANAVKIEGGANIYDSIAAIVDASIPVCGHIGMTPQSVNAMGGFKVQGKDIKKAQQLIEDARAFEDAGAFMVTLECVPSRLSEIITRELSIPTIGIGAGAGCDGQVLVYQDMLNMFPGHQAKFVKHFAEVGEEMRKGFKAYISEVKEGVFPSDEHSFKIDDEVIENLELGKIRK